MADEKKEEKVEEGKEEETVEETSISSTEETSEKMPEKEVSPTREKIAEEHQEQSPDDKRMAYKIRVLEKRIKQLEEGGGLYEKEYSAAADKREDYDRDDYREEFNQRFSEIKAFQDTERRLQSFFVKNPEYKKYEDKIRENAFNPALQNISVAFVAQATAGRDVLRDEIKAKKLADAEAKKTKTGGSSSRTISPEKDYIKMDKDEFAKVLAEIRSKGQ